MPPKIKKYKDEKMRSKFTKTTFLSDFTMGSDRLTKPFGWLQNTNRKHKHTHGTRKRQNQKF